MRNCKHDFLIKKCRWKSVLHIGPADYPLHEEKAKKNELLHQKINWISKSLVGLENNKNAIEDLKQYNIHNIYYWDIISWVYDKEILNKKYDIIIFPDVIEHLENPGIALENIKKLRSDNTEIIITTPNVWSIFTIQNYFLQKEDVHEDHCFWPSQKTMWNMLSRCWLQILDTWYLFYRWEKDIKSILWKIIKPLLLKKIEKLAPVLYFIVK